MRLSTQDRSARPETQLPRANRRNQARERRLGARGWAHALLGVAAACGVSLVACEGCRGTSTPKPTIDPAAGQAPSVRLYFVSDLAGALEPCGCVKDQLGGLDHAASFIRSERAHAPNAALVTAGPLFFMDPTLREERRAQEVAKAETLSSALKDLGLVALAPGRNDWAAGEDKLLALAHDSGGAIVLANLTTPASKDAWVGSMVRDIGGVKVGFVGVAMLDADGVPPAGPVATPPEDAVKREVAALQQQGAQVVIALAAVGRGEAKRIADVAPTLTAILVGSTSQGGDVNTDTPSAERVGDVLIAQTGNHLQTVATLDLFVRENDFTFQDASGLDQSKKREDLVRRIDDLRGKIATWEKEGKVQQADIDARRADLQKLEDEKKALDTPPAPAKGSFFRYTVTEVRDSLGKDDTVGKELLAYYKKVNDANKLAFAGKLPPKPGPDDASYAGVDACTSCHASERKFWDKTAHKNGYTTLSSQFKEFNLDCVSCHVTGYDKVGGSTVAHVEKLEAVQCEVCHGPSSKHAAKPAVPPPVPRPTADLCLTCHHPPHVHTFDANAKMAEITGPGHGRSASP